MVCMLMVVGVAASYPAWSPLVGQISSSISLDPTYQTNSTSIAASNMTVVDSWENTTEPNIFSLPTVTTTESQTGEAFGADWVSQFFSVVDGYRGGESLTECASLDSFAMARFDTMTNGTNWEITHYGYAQDESKAFGGTVAFFAEEYFYPTQPSLRTPEDFATLVKDTAPGHWSDLMASSTKYYGAYFDGQGPVLLFDAGCGPLEMGPGINQTAAFSGCPYQQVSGNWLVIELSSVCPQ